MMLTRVTVGMVAMCVRVWQTSTPRRNDKWEQYDTKHITHKWERCDKKQRTTRKYHGNSVRMYEKTLTLWRNDKWERCDCVTTRKWISLN